MLLLLNSLALANIPGPYQASDKETLQVPLCALFFSLGGEREFTKSPLIRTLGPEGAPKCGVRFVKSHVTQGAW